MIKYKIKSIHNRSKSRKNWIHHSFWSISDVIKFLKKAGTRKFNIPYQGVEVTLKSLKNVLILNQNICQICKLPVTYAVLEKVHKDVKTYHFNYYTIHPETKKEILFNIDHIVPKSKGGNNLITNLQLTCELCNTQKGNKFSKWEYYWKKLKNFFINKFKIIWERF